MNQQTKGMLFLFLVAAVAMIFIGASCSTEESTSEDSTSTTEEDINLDEFCSSGGSSTTTPHNSTICDGKDTALIGTWQLQSQTVVGSSLRLAGSPPNAEGRKLTFYDIKSYAEDYSTEKLERVTKEGITEQCKASGSNSGDYFVTFEIIGEDDSDDIPEPDEDQVRTYLEVTRDANLDPEGIKVTCDEAPGATVESSVASTPLGTGMTASSCDGDFMGSPCVKYSYSISEDGSLLTISTTTGPSATYTFKKAS